MSKENPKVYYCNSFLSGCYYVRCLVPLREGGWDGDKTSIRGQNIPPELQSKAVLDADVVVFHRPNDERSLQIAQILKAQGKKIVADNDDTYKEPELRRLGKLFEKVDEGLDTFVKFADMVTCSTEYLAEEYRKLNKNVLVLPNCIDPDDWPEPERNETSKVRIGLVGSVAINGDSDEFLPTLKALSKRDDVQLVLMSLPAKNKSTEKMVQKIYKSDYEFWEQIENIEWHPFVEQADYAEALNDLKLDIMVIPRKDDYFNRCKSNIKFLEASILQIPVVAQGFADGKSPYQVDPEDAAHMEIVTDNSKWMESLEPLIQDKAKRRDMGRNAQEYVLSKYQIKDRINMWEEAYKNLCQE